MKKTLLLIVALLTLSITADAKWWIFGKSNAEIGLKYLQVNKIAADETGPKIKVFREMLAADGLIRINGRGSTGRNAVGSVRISLDDKATWSDVKFSENGTFEYAFKPEPGKTYIMLVEITDTAGKTNKVDETRKEIALSDENIQAKVRETLDAMFDAYNTESLEKFMVRVGDNFAGDKAILERAVKRDFDALGNISLRYTINNVSAGAQGRVFVSVTYNRMVFVNKTGASSTDTGSTEFVFDSKEGALSLFSMKQPLMFGLSDAENVATGTVIGGGETALVLDDSGDIGGALATRSYNSADAHFGYNFETQQFEDCDGTAANCTGQVFFMPGVPYIGVDDNPETTARIGELPGRSASSATLADIEAAATLQQVFGAFAGKTFGIKYGADRYALEITSLSGSGTYSITVRTKAF
ncbi:MAG TPA: hypothetical protein DCS63_04465 [Elusimicrobia bacterium]|nr:hypothetical protein [Elusimicrobiota bacterium]